ncbi:MAG: potassium transporter TrkG [Pseudomonadota bacterium]
MAASSHIVEPTRSSSRKSASLDLRPILLVIGILLIILALFMAPPMVADLAVGNPDWQVFLAASGVTLFAGVNLLLMNRAPGLSEITGRQAFLLTTLVWVVISFFGALPFMFSELELDLADAVFETMSGITTTGSTVIVGLDHAPPGILLWRAILNGSAVLESSSWVSPSCRSCRSAACSWCAPKARTSPRKSCRAQHRSPAPSA